MKKTISKDRQASKYMRVEQTKNAIYIMTFSDLWSRLGHKGSENYKIKPVLYVGLERTVHPPDIFENVPFYDVNSARKALPPAQVVGYCPATIDAELLSFYAPYEAILYEMLSRFLPGKNSASFQDRRAHIWELIRIWEGLFEALNPTIIVCGSMPHRVFDFVAYLVSKRKNIRFVAPENTSVPHLSYIANGVGALSQKFEISSENNAKKLMFDTEKYIQHVKSDESYRPKYFSATGMHSAALESTFKARIIKQVPTSFWIIFHLVNKIFRGTAFAETGTFFKFSNKGNEDYPCQKVTFVEKAFFHLKTVRDVKAAQKWYRNSITADLPRNFVFFPSNYQPERSSLPDAGYFSEYYLIISMLDRALPAGWAIVFKEHPRTFRNPIAADNPRNIDQFLKLKRASNRLVFVDERLPSKDLIQKSMFVVVACGTAGWEAVVRGKPVTCFGDTWYRRMKGVYAIDSIESLIEAIESIKSNPITCLNDVRKYLASVEASSMDMRFYFKDMVLSRKSIGRSKQHDELQNDAEVDNYSISRLSAKIFE